MSECPTPSYGTGDNDHDVSFELTPKDRYILELNHHGLSYRKISERLKLDYGIELSKSAVSRRLRELMQDPANYVKILKCNIPQKPREETRWFKVIEWLQKAIPEYVELNGFKPSSRTMFYQAQDEGIVEKKEHTAFVRATVEARLGWEDSEGNPLYPELDVDCFADDDSRKVVGYYDNSLPTEPTDPGPIPDPEEYIGHRIYQIKKAIEAYDGVGEEGEPGERGGRWYNQSEYVEVWEEKVDLLPGFEKLLEGKGIKIRANKGFPSLVFLNQCCQELKEVIDEMGFDPEHIHITYSGDWDPSGEGMVYYIKKRLRQLGIEDVDVERIAVTPQQIDEYNLPLMPLDPDPGKKPDPNLHEFKRRYGDKATHLNAFFTKDHIKDFEKILVESVDKHWDKSIYDEMVDEYDGAEPEEPGSLDEEELNDTKKMMCKLVSDEFYPGWGADSEYYEEDENKDPEDETEDDENEE
jgi:hypothetical protein